MTPPETVDERELRDLFPDYFHKMIDETGEDELEDSEKSNPYRELVLT
jgi:hypothetical protein